MGDKVIPVQVAVRIRPLVTKEIAKGSKQFISKVEGEPQIVIKGSAGSDESFTYDFVFGPKESQNSVYETAVKELLPKIFQGYNVTVLAYGQTGSGKTFTMGTAETSGTVSQNCGIIQQAVKDLFSSIGEESNITFDIKISFLELYMEKVYDLLGKRAERAIREDPNTGIRIDGLTETSVKTWEDTLKCLEKGSLIRKTGATAMNEQSSRSHAVFTLTVNQITKDSKKLLKCSKFHLVDLAGSERASRTESVGDRFAEGVKINKGLSSLGNVISALCEANPRHIPYRDSKLTRLLQDSLGGNSHTLMLACVGPGNSNYEETMSTLRYADRARKIKNKPIVNQDPILVENRHLRAQVADLERRLKISENRHEEPAQPLPAIEGNTAMPLVEDLLLSAQVGEQETEKLLSAQQLLPAIEDATLIEVADYRAQVAELQRENEQMKRQLQPFLAAQLREAMEHNGRAIEESLTRREGRLPHLDDTRISPIRHALINELKILPLALSLPSQTGDVGFAPSKLLTIRKKTVMDIFTSALQPSIETQDLEGETAGQAAGNTGEAVRLTLRQCCRLDSPHPSQKRAVKFAPSKLPTMRKKTVINLSTSGEEIQPSAEIRDLEGETLGQAEQDPNDLNNNDPDFKSLMD